jgi:hypothetical protein
LLTWATRRSPALVPGGVGRTREPEPAAFVAARNTIVLDRQLVVAVRPDGGCSRSAARALAGLVVLDVKTAEAVGSVRTAATSASAATRAAR